MTRHAALGQSVATIFGLLIAGAPQAPAVAQAAAVAPAASAPVVQGDGQRLTVACAGAAAAVAGNRNSVAFTGVCKSLALRGDSNKVTLSLTEGAGIDVQGNGNTVHLAGGTGLRLSVSGNHTSIIAPAASTPPSSAARIAGDDQSITLDCTGQAVTLDTNRSHYTLRGGCKSLSLRGAGDRVDAELLPGAPVRIEGDDIIVTYRLKGVGARPEATVIGMGSLAQPDWRVAQLQAPPAPPAGITEVPRLMAGLQGSVVMEGTQVDLAAPMFAGTALRADGAQQVGMLAQLIGLIHPRGLRIVSADPADAPAAWARAASVQAALDRLGVAKLPTQSVKADGGTAQVSVVLLR